MDGSGSGSDLDPQLCRFVSVFLLLLFYFNSQYCLLKSKILKLSYFGNRANQISQIRVFNYNTLERVHNFDAHSDYVRAIAVHPTQPFILTSSGKQCKLYNC